MPKVVEDNSISSIFSNSYTYINEHIGYLNTLHTHRSLRAAFQTVYAAVRRRSPASIAASGAPLPLAMALSCTHRSASSRVGRAPLVVASVHHSSTALVRWALGAAYRGHCRYTCMVVSGMPAHAAQCSRPSGPTLPYTLARPPFVRACACQRAIAGGAASTPFRYHAPMPLAAHRRYRRSMFRCTSSPLSSSRRTPRWCVVSCCRVYSSVVSGAPWSYCTVHFRASAL